MLWYGRGRMVWYGGREQYDHKIIIFNNRAPHQHIYLRRLSLRFSVCLETLDQDEDPNKDPSPTARSFVISRLAGM